MIWNKIFKNQFHKFRIIQMGEFSTWEYMLNIDFQLVTE